MLTSDHMENNCSEPVRRVACPTCKRVVRIPAERSGKLPPFFPFCSERCKMIDLGAWFDADYRIAAKPNEESEEAIGENSPLAAEPPEP